MSRCIEHAKALSPGPEGALTCRICNASWMSPEEMEALAKGALGFLTVETREKCGAFAKNLHCPDCEGLLTPMRIGKLDGWVEYCGICERYWVDRVDKRSLQMLTKREEKQKAYGTLSPEEKKELVSAMAQSTPTLDGPQEHSESWLAILGIPVLEGVQRERAPLMSVSLALFMVLMFVLGKAFPEVFAPWSHETHWTCAFWANFVHFDIFHLLINVWFLLLLGDALEQKLHRFLLLSVFLILAPLHLVFQVFSMPEYFVGGADNAIFMLMGASAVLQHRARFVVSFFWYRLLYTRSPWVRRIVTLRIPIWVFAILLVFSQLTKEQPGIPGFTPPNIDWRVHLSSLLIGVALAFLLKKVPNDTQVPGSVAPHPKVAGTPKRRVP